MTDVKSPQLNWIIKKEEYFDKIICEKLANDVKLNEKIDKLP